MSPLVTFALGLGLGCVVAALFARWRRRQWERALEPAADRLAEELVESSLKDGLPLHRDVRRRQL